jgi:predicted nucleotide-binding protein
VHGQDEEMKQAVARVLQSMSLEPIILHEQPDGNKTIIEKFEKYSDVDFAVILLSPDDFAYRKGESPSDGKFRARQNVILELGYFLAKLNREGVFILYRQDDNFEFPSDYSGVLYTLYDKSGAWKNRLADEMAVLDPQINKNRQ